MPEAAVAYQRPKVSGWVGLLSKIDSTGHRRKCKTLSQQVKLKRDWVILALELTLLHDFGRELVDYFKRLEIVQQLFGLGGTEDAGRDMRVLERPCECDMCDRDALSESGGKLRKLLDLGQLCFAFGRVESLGFIREVLETESTSIGSHRQYGRSEVLL